MGEKVRPLQFFEPSKINFFAKEDAAIFADLEYIKRRQKRLKENGLCEICGQKDIDENSNARCRTCLDVKKESTRRYIINHIKYNLCQTGCGRILATKNYCRECADKDAARHKARRQRLNKTRVQ